MADFNQQLADQRANAVEEYLEGKGVNGKQLDTVAFGQDNPLCTEHNESCWATNRRASIRPRNATR